RMVSASASGATPSSAYRSKSGIDSGIDRRIVAEQPGPARYHPGVETTAPAILEIGIVLLAAVAAGFVARRIGLPAVVGYLLVGRVVSPFTPGYVAAPDQLPLLADVGVVLLLFEVGIEVDLRTLRREQRA